MDTEDAPKDVPVMDPAAQTDSAPTGLIPSQTNPPANQEENIEPMDVEKAPASPDQHPQSFRIEWMPEELLLQVFQYLDVNSMMACRGVCTAWRRVAGDRSLWQTVELLPGDMCCLAHSSRALAPVSPFINKLCIRCSDQAPYCFFPFLVEDASQFLFANLRKIVFSTTEADAFQRKNAALDEMLSLTDMRAVFPALREVFIQIVSNEPSQSSGKMEVAVCKFETRDL